MCNTVIAQNIFLFSKLAYGEREYPLFIFQGGIHTLDKKDIVFGPVPSRRLGRSIGVNNIPPKSCDYSCIYCQLGRTPHMSTDRKEFYPVSWIEEAVCDKLSQIVTSGDAADYLTFVSDGEPTLDINIGNEIRAISGKGLPVAVITNASLLWQKEVREDLMAADLVSVKVDAAYPAVWRRIDRPCKDLSLEKIFDGIRTFANDFEGKLITETMLVRGVNDDAAHLQEVAEFISGLGADTSYISIPIRPPAESRALPPDEHAVARAYSIFSKQLSDVEYLIGYEGDSFSSTGDTLADICAITSVHPMKREAVGRLLENAGLGWDSLDTLIENGTLVTTSYRGDTFYVRGFKKE